jgi:predicted permease
LRGALVSIEVALAFTLLISSGLLLHSAWLIQRLDPGFDVRGVFTARLMLPPARYPAASDVTGAFARIRDAAARIPGVRSAALATIPPLSGLAMSSSVSIDAKPQATDAPEANIRIVSPGYFATMGIGLRAGRDLVATDNRSSPKVVVISEALGRLLWPGFNPRQILGRRLNGLSTSDDQPNMMEVIGVVGDAHDEQVTADAKPTFYVPVDQMPEVIWPMLQRAIVVVLKSATPDADATILRRPLSRAIADVDPSLPIADAHTMMRALASSQATARMTTVLLSALGGIALLLAMVGIYGVVSYFVGQRTQEIGVRMALGATHARIWRFVVRRGLAPVALGLVVGIGLSMVTTRALRGQLYGVTGRDPLTLVSVTALLGMVALAAIYVPARRAMRVAPARAFGEG